MGSTGTAKTAYNDTTADPATNYYYTVRAINSVGTGLSSNEVSPAVVALPPPESACVAPGLTRLTDPSGDGVIAGSDLKSLQIAQPYYSDGLSRLTFTINTDPGQAVQPLGSAWYVSMKMVNGTTTTYKGVRMVWNGATPTFESYTPGPNSSGTVDGRFLTSGSQKPAESGSYNAPYDKVVITVRASDLGLGEGSVISGFVSGVAQPANPTNTGANAVALYDQMPNSLAYASGYTVDNQACRPNTAPTAVLTASPTSGFAPLTVTFDGSGSSDPDTAAPADTIASYRFDFGDGTSTTQSTPTTTHSYANPATYSAALTVTDSRGAVSTNSAQQIITVNGQPDLIVSNLVASNSNPKLNEKVKFSATITNIGKTQSLASKTQFLLDGTTQIGLIDTPLLAPGASATVSVPWTAKAKRGTHTIKATADKTTLVSESNETNNDKSITINIL